MRWAWKIGVVRGIGIYVHFTFLLLVTWVAVGSYMARGSAADAISSILFLIPLFAIIVLHELGHALTAQRFGIQTRDITLYPIGGVARLERMPDDPRQELLVALAGPAVNVVLAGLLYLILVLRGTMESWSAVHWVSGNLLLNLFWINVVLAGFNLLPAFPMDGGRILRALLATRMDAVRATQIAAAIGQSMAILFAVFGFLSHNPFLLFIALFVWMGAAQEASVAQVKTALASIPVSHVMMTEFHVLGPDDPLRVAVQHLLAGYHLDFPVVSDGEVLGILTRSNLVEGLSRYGEAAPVAEVMSRDFLTVDASEMAEVAIARLQQMEQRSAIVVRNGELAGLLSLENIGEFLLIRGALARRRQGTRTAFPLP
ncbi:Putative zinc metalloprotease Rip3 [Methylacidimicrobium cyclopophantes]|uniref:Zinc metalloprotease n=2 Tax=Methylacidimicrobium cyclopophantes TaxID=1041766 RepID=A0A5E6M967_9BACT|nr:site-2 protease family protein [Methylacidimicrobium cyclopophantes]VVM04923.1 Putative zinc metalloprotease Rip3 [Methylacidimicrobium cyclopophantes]